MAINSHKRDTNARLSPVKIAAPIAVFATLASVGVGVLTANVEKTSSVTANQASFADLAGEDRSQTVSRSRSRLDELADRAARAERAERAERAAELAARAERAARAAPLKAIRNASKYLWSTAELNLWTSAGDGAEQVGVLDSGQKVLVTGRRDNGRAELVLGGKARWVTAEYLSAEKPEPETAGLGGACTNGTSVPSGVSENIKKVHEAVCAAFPEITVYGTFRDDGEHAQGLAVDIMVSGDRGYQVAEFVRAHFAELGVNYVIYSQRIWSVDRGSEGWRGMEDRGSTTANHYDHVHVTTY